MKLINLTPHPVNLHRADGTVETIAPEDTPARLAVTDRPVGDLNGIPLVEATFGAPTGLPNARRESPSSWTVQ